MQHSLWHVQRLLSVLAGCICHFTVLCYACRQGAGVPLLGKSFTYPAARRNMRIDFQFDKAAFHFKFLPFTLPYPVPFKILGDERKVRACMQCVMPIECRHCKTVQSAVVAYKCLVRCSHRALAYFISYQPQPNNTGACSFWRQLICFRAIAGLDRHHLHEC